MTYIPEHNNSYWIDSTPTDLFPSLATETFNGTSVDVAIVGAGIAGVTTAALLKKAGKTVALIEAKSISTGVSGHTTAKVTSLHQLIYDALINDLGEDKARLYGQANQAALERIATWVEDEQIDCDFSRQAAYSFAETPEELDQIKAEVEAATRLGLPASFVTDTSLPFPVAGAIKFDHQAQFHPRKYLLHLARAIAGDGSYVFESTQVQSIEEGTPCQVITNKGVVHARDVVVTTNLPFLDQGLFFAKAYPKRSYIIGAHIDSQAAPEGMFIGVGQPYYSIRTTPHDKGTLLLIGGGGHKVGSVTHTDERYHQLESFARDRFGITTVDYRWSTQDMVSFDKLPYVGKLTPFSNHVYVATGFSLWGMTNGTVSGMILSDLILGIENPWAELYDATRATPFVSQESLKQNMDVATHWVGDRLKGFNHLSMSEIDVGEGKLVTVDGKKIAAYRDESGQVHAVSPVCTHLGCIVQWNNAERSWDCPCHGARFNCDGAVLHGPAIKPLESYQEG